MPSKMIGFRVSDDAVSALEGVMEPGESLNQTAQRVLLQALGVASGNRSATVNNAVNSLVNVDVNNQLADFKQEMEGKLSDIKADLYAELTDQINELVEARLGESVA